MRSTALSMAPRNPRRALKSSASTHPSTRPDPSTHPSTQARHRPRGSRCSPWGGSSPSLGRCSRSTSRASRSTSTPRGARAAPLLPAPPRNHATRLCVPTRARTRAARSSTALGHSSRLWGRAVIRRGGVSSWREAAMRHRAARRVYPTHRRRSARFGEATRCHTLCLCIVGSWLEPSSTFWQRRGMSALTCFFSECPGLSPLAIECD